MAQSISQIQFDHIHLMTAEPEKTAKWFAEVLGAEVMTSPVRTHVEIGGLSIFFDDVSAKPDTKPAPAHPHRGTDHFAFTVKNIDEVAAEMKKKGAVFTKEPFTTRPGVRIFFIEGPEGISIEYLERDDKYV